VRGRKPQLFQLKPQDAVELHQLIRDGHTPQRIARRARILLARADQHRVQEVAAKVELDAATIWRVCNRYQQTGLHVALYDAPRSGCPRRLTPSQLTTLSELLTQGAVAHGWPNDIWTAKRVVELIKRDFDLDFSCYHVRTILKKHLGWTLQRPIQRVKERDEPAIKQWKEIEFPRIAQDTRSRNGYLVFVDESGFMLAPTSRVTYAPRGKPPVIKVSDPHGRVSVAGALIVSPMGKRLRFLYHLLPDNVNFHGDSAMGFLVEICQQVSGPITIVWDRFSIHSSDPVNHYLERHRRISVEEFPAYAPELNPVDNAWFYLKYDRLPNFAPATMVELRHRLIQELMALQVRADVLAWCVKQTGLSLELS
jgi:transposase